MANIQVHTVFLTELHDRFSSFLCLPSPPIVVMKRWKEKINPDPKQLIMKRQLQFKPPISDTDLQRCSGCKYFEILQFLIAKILKYIPDYCKLFYLFAFWLL